jgi:hypothetical protein
MLFGVVIPADNGELLDGKLGVPECPERGFGLVVGIEYCNAVK